MTDMLIPDPAAVLQAWRARVRANREQVEQVREDTPSSDFYAPVATMFRADPRRRDEPTLEVLRTLVEPSDVILDIGAGGGRYALPLALASERVIALEPSAGMRAVLAEGMAEFGISNIHVVDGRWPEAAAQQACDVALVSHLGYDVEEIGPFLDAMESVARRKCIAVLLSQPPPTEADRLWPLVHGIERASLPSLPEFLLLLLARRRLFQVQLVERSPQSYEQPEQGLAWLRQQLWTAPGSAKDQQLQRLMRERVQERDGRYALNWAPVQVGIVTWRPPA
jgi:SAM-dependent methyltransferase